jgi:hypothetical protein
MNTTLFQIYLKIIWPKRQECERLVRLEYLTENSFDT